MVDIAPADVKRLREATGAGMMDCKNALADAEGDFDRAAELVRERTGAKMADRASERTASEGLVHAYLHTPTPGLPPKVGVLVELSCETDFVAKNEQFQQLAQDLGMQIAAMHPAVVRESDVDEATLEAERRVAEHQAREEGKPEHVIDKIVDGKVKAFYKERVLLNQPFVRDDSRTVGELVEELQRTTGEKVEVARFARFEVGA